jgi:hypothetical protein
MSEKKKMKARFECPIFDILAHLLFLPYRCQEYKE